MLEAILGIIPGFMKLGSEMIKDPDKQMEFAFKTQDAILGFLAKIVETPTVPWVDALVKLMLAFGQVFKGFLRPLGSFALAGFAAYCQAHNITLPESVQVMMYGAPVAWGASRHVEKREKAKQKKRDSDPFWFETD